MRRDTQSEGQPASQTDRQTGMTKLTVAFCNFASAPITGGEFKKKILNTAYTSMFFKCSGPRQLQKYHKLIAPTLLYYLHA